MEPLQLLEVMNPYIIIPMDLRKLGNFSFWQQMEPLQTKCDYRNRNLGNFRKFSLKMGLVERPLARTLQVQEPCHAPYNRAVQ
jgi:hypothetical protein